MQPGRQAAGQVLRQSAPGDVGHAMEGQAAPEQSLHECPVRAAVGRSSASIREPSSPGSGVSALTWFISRMRRTRLKPLLCTPLLATATIRSPATTARPSISCSSSTTATQKPARS